MQRRSLETMVFPQDVLPVDRPTLASALADRFGATIVGSDGGYELQCGEPSNLIVVIWSTHVELFEDVERSMARLETEEDDPAHSVPDEESAESGAERVIHAIEEILGLYVDDVADDADEPDDADRRAKRMLDRLIETGAIELVTPRSRAGVEGKLAHLIARGANALAVHEALMSHEGVAEIYVDEHQLAPLLSTPRSGPDRGR